MTVKQLKAELAKYPDNMDVFLADRKTDFKYGLLNGVKEQEIDFMEDPYGEVLATYTVLILDEV